MIFVKFITFHYYMYRYNKKISIFVQKNITRFSGDIGWIVFQFILISLRSIGVNLGTPHLSAKS